MAISRTKKEELVGAYGSILDTAVNAVILSQSGLSNNINTLRKGLKKVNGQIMIVKKKIVVEIFS